MHPVDLDAWRAWQGRQNRLRKFRASLRPALTPTMWLAVRGTAPRILVAMDATTPTQRASLLKPLELLDGTAAAVLMPSYLPGLLAGEWTWSELPAARLPEELRAIRVVLAVGHYLPVGALAARHAQQVGAQFLVVQHGLLTPHAPPLPRHSTLLAFSEQDAQYAMSQRSDVTHHVVGSQLLWDAAQSARVTVSSERPVFLGQLHGAELPRLGLARAAMKFCTAADATYRPHPSETDKLSRFQHTLWEKRGIRIDRSGTPLVEVAAPVVSVFSTGVLEAAARGIPAWVTYQDPPSWLEEFWNRYGMSPWGSEPTPAPAHGDQEPAVLIAHILQTEIGASS